MVINKPFRRNGPTFAFAGGGTGGHLYPAMAISDAVRECRPDALFLFFVTERAIDERILESCDCDVVPQTLPRFERAPWRWPGILAGLRRSSRSCRSQFHCNRIAAVVGTGGLASVPAVFSARRAGLPTLLLNPDALVGKANKILAPFADIVCVQWEETARFLPRGSRVRALGCPIRSGFSSPMRAHGIGHFGLDPGRKTLLVTGASQGARSINQAVLANLHVLQAFSDWQVIHLTGAQDFAIVAEAYRRTPIPCRVAAFTDRMADALVAADLVVSRAGASTLAEITAVGRPSILMPYPFHKDQHQLMNARCLARASAARIVPDAVDPAMNGPALRRALEQLMSDQEARTAMASAARQMGRPDAARRVAETILALAADRGSLASAESLEQQ